MRPFCASAACNRIVRISLQGATLRPDDDWNSELYSSPLTNKQIVLGDTPAPPAAAKLLAALDKYSSRK